MPSHDLSRRQFLTSAAAAASLPLLTPRLAFAVAPGAFVPPGSPRATYNFNLGWQFLRDDADGAEAPGFDDTKWATISTPHSFNDVDSFRVLIQHGGGDRGMYKGIAWYRKRFAVPKELAGQTIFLEFEGMRQAGDIFLNGKPVGLYENGVTPYGVDISKSVLFGGKENVLAVKIDNRTTYQERATGTAFEWNANDFNPDHGGINRPVWLHTMGPVHQTLPLFYGLQTQGIYVRGADFNIAKKSCTVNLDAEVRNGLSDRATVELSAMVVDAAGNVAATLSADPVDMVAGEKSVISATGSLANARFWSIEDPHLYEIYSVLKIDGKVVDVARTTTGFRKAEFKGGVGKGGVYLNEKFVYLKGYAQRSSNEWAGLGGGYPAWLHEYTAQMMRASHANYVRWMHVAPQPVDAMACARNGIVQVCPAGDKERDVEGRQWDQRVEVMRATIVYHRNNPSILFWEAGNMVVSADHMKQMVALRKEVDPDGMRVMGVRGSDSAANPAVTPYAEYFGVMLGQDPKIDKLTSPTELFRAYSAERRDRAPIIETEDFRDEGARRYWDDDSPPYFGFKKGTNDTYEYTSESFALAGVRRYVDYFANRISNTDPAHSKWSGYASIYFSDSDADGRQDSSEVARVSGKVDAVRLPKEIYYAHRVIQADRQALHILGHWTYPEDKKVKKTVYVIANVQSVQLLLNGKPLGTNAKPESGFIFAFPNVSFEPGSLKAVGSIQGQAIVEQELTTAGPAAAVKLTPMVSPAGFLADGQDAALFDVEVVDAKGRRCPTDDARIDFTCTGPSIWRGGYNSGKIESTNNLYLNTELGVNRVAVRSTLTPGKITITAKREGLTAASATVESRAVSLTAGLARV